MAFGAHPADTILLNPSFKHSVPHSFLLHLQMLLKHNRVDGKYKMLTRPRKHVKGHLNFQRLKSKQFIPVFVLNAWYLFLYFQPTWKTVMLCGLKMLSRFRYPIYMCSYFQEKNHICKCPQKVSDKRGPTARDQVVKSAWEQGLALAKKFPS